MFYVVEKASPRHRNVDIEDLWFKGSIGKTLLMSGKTETVTTARQSLTGALVENSLWNFLEQDLKNFNDKYSNLLEQERDSLYYKFYIAKSSGGLREINAPIDELKGAFLELKDIFEKYLERPYHTNAFGFIKGRDVVSAIQKHQSNESMWFLKLDLKDFFPNSTKNFILDMLKIIYPFNVLHEKGSWSEMEKAIDLCILSEGLPQGSNISPLLTNLAMIPIDYHITKLFRENNKETFVYTRYADDMTISSKVGFSFSEKERDIKAVLSQFNAPFTINSDKTRYGSRNGANWNLGIMLNQNNEITVGHKNKKRFKTMIFNYGKDKLNGRNWDYNDIQILDGHRSWYSRVEPETIEKIITHISEKIGLDIRNSIRQDLKLVRNTD